MKKRNGSERGNILVVAVIVALVMLLMAIPFLMKLSGQSRSTDRAYRALSAFNLAEAGADRVLWEMNRPFTVPGGGLITADANGNLVFGPAAESVGDRTGHFQGTIVENLATWPNTRTLISQGLMPYIADRTVDRSVEIVLEKYYKSIWDFGFFVDISFFIGRNFLVDSYDSRDGAYGGSNVGNWGYFGTNGTAAGSWTIDQSTSSVIQGAVAAGYQTLPEDLETTVDIPAGTQGSFDTMILSSEFEMPSVNLFDLPPKDMFGTQGDQTLESWFTPEFKESYLTYDEYSGQYAYQMQDFMPSKADLNGSLRSPLTVAEGGSRTLTAADSGVYTSFSMGRNSTVTVTEHVVMYVTGVEGAASEGKFYIGGGNIQIADGGSLTLILGNTSFFTQNTTNINVNADNSVGTPANCLILGTDQFQPIAGDVNTTRAIGKNAADPGVGYMNLENNGTIAAALYAPRATMTDQQGQANIQMYGAAVTRTMDWKTNISFHYDEALGDLMTIVGGLPYWKVVSWQERLGQ